MVVSVLVAGVLVGGPVGRNGGAAAVTASPQPAFYTYQAPGGAGTAGQRVIALTFDDGPGPYTLQVVNVLRQYHVPATFFEIGENAAHDPAITKQVGADGFPVQDHTWNHPDLTTIPVSGFPTQIDQTQAEIESLTGVAPACVRPPYDAWNATVLQQLTARHLTTMSYSIDPRDWSNPGTSAIVARVVEAATPGGVVDLHDGANAAETVAALPQMISQLRAKGYSFVSICGAPAAPARQQQSAVYSPGQAPAAGAPVISDRPFVGIAGAPALNGYWLTAGDGGVFSFGGVRFYGSTGAVHLVEPIVAMAATPDERGYWLVAADGGVFGFGDARFYGSIGGVRLAQPIIGITSTPDGRGYWLAASDGGIFGFGDARFYGSTGGIRLTQPVVGMAATGDGRGYWLVAADGGMFGFGDAGFFGSTGGIHLAHPVVAAAATSDSRGYWLLAADGGVFGFGDARFFGSGVGRSPAGRFFGIAPGLGGQGYLLASAHPPA